MTKTHVRSGVALVVLMSALFAFQNCGQGFQSVTGGLLGGSSVFQTATLQDQFTFSKDFVPPSSKQGIMESRRVLSGGEQDARYARLKGAGARYRHYNMYWQEIEKTNVVSSTSPVSCPSGSTMYPANESDRASLGFHKFRCLDDYMMGTYDVNFRRDMDNGMQSAIVLYTTPPAYRYDGCVGFSFGSDFLKIGCVPRDDAMDDFEDFANALAQRYNGGANGKITHWIVWNENASTDWFDYTPVVSHTATDAGSINRRIDKYVDMMKRVHQVLLRHERGVMMYVSTDQLWARPGGVPGHMGTQTLLDGIWDRLGTNYSWAVSVHPYQDVDRPAPPGIYTWANIEVVVNYMNQKLAERGVSDPRSYPQGMLIAGEQGWPGARDYQARQICLAHNRAMQNPQIIAVANNTFQDISGQDTQGGSSYGLIPAEIPSTLAGMESTPTGQAYLSTLDPALWNVRADHYCCQAVGVGCGTQTAPNHDVKGNVDAIVGNQLRGWACANGIGDSIKVHVYAGAAAGQGGHMVVEAAANNPSEQGVADACGAGGSFRFAIELSNDARAAYAGQPLFVHGISPVGGENKVINNSGNVAMPGADARQPATETPSRPTVVTVPEVQTTVTNPNPPTAVVAASPDIVRAGFFQVQNQGTIYWSNGGDAYCGKQNWDDFVTTGGNSGNTLIVSHLPASMRNDGGCPLAPTPAGFFRQNQEGTIYYSNGGDAFCAIPNWESFLAMGGQGNLSNVRSLVSGLPSNMRNDGVCAAAAPSAAEVAQAQAAAAQAQAASDQAAQAQAQAAAQANADQAAALAAAQSANQSTAYVYAYSAIYRFYQSLSGEHFFTASWDEGNNAGYGYEGIGFNVVGANLPGTHGVYRCLYAGGHFVSTDPGCEGQNGEGQYGALYNDGGNGRTALYRLVQPSTGDHLTSTNMVEGIGNGYVLEGRIGFTPQ